MRILVTGASGFIGRRLAAALAGDDNITLFLLLHRDQALAQLEQSLSGWSGNVELVTADLRNYAAIKAVISRTCPDLIYHLASAGVRDPFLPLKDALEHNLHGTVNLIQAAFEGHEDGGVKQVIAARTPGERSVMNHYAASKAAAWQICRMYARTQAWPIIGAMIFQVYGPGQPPGNLLPAAIRAAKNDEDFPMTAGNQKRDWIFIDDVVGGLVKMAQSSLSPGVSVDLGTGQLTSVAEAVQQVYQMVGGAGRPLIGNLPSRPGEEQIQTADVGHTKRLIDWKSSIAFQDGLRIMINQDLS